MTGELSVSGRGNDSNFTAPVTRHDHLLFLSLNEKAFNPTKCLSLASREHIHHNFARPVFKLGSEDKRSKQINTIWPFDFPLTPSNVAWSCCEGKATADPVLPSCYPPALNNVCTSLSWCSCNQSVTARYFINRRTMSSCFHNCRLRVFICSFRAFLSCVTYFLLRISLGAVCEELVEAALLVSRA